MVAVCIHTEHALLPEQSEQQRGRNGEQHDREPESLRCRQDAESVRRQHAQHDRDRNDDVLNASENRQRRERAEDELDAQRCTLAQVHARAHRSEHERICERIGEHRPGVHGVGNRDGERGDTERKPACEAETTGEEVGRQRGDGDLGGMQRLRQAPGGFRILRHEPHRRHDERLEQRGEVRAGAADQRSPVLGEAAGERRVDVFVGQVEGDDPSERGKKPPAEAPPRGKPSALLDTRVIYCGDCLEQLKKLPPACVDLIYIGPLLWP